MSEQLSIKIRGFLASRLTQWPNRSMPRDQLERAFGQLATRRNFVPGRCARGMRQRNQVETVLRSYDAEFLPNHLLQPYTIDKLRNRQSANRNNETRAQNSDLIIHPPRAIANLIRRWDAVGAARTFTRETAADGSEIDFRSNGGFVHSAKLFEPTEECFAGGVRERPFQRRFPRTGRLANDYYIADDRAA